VLVHHRPAHHPEEILEHEKANLIAVLERCKREGIRLEWEILQEGQSSACHEEEPLGEALARSVRTITGNAPRFGDVPRLLETRFYAAQGVPAYAYGPGLLSVAHGPKDTSNPAKSGQLRRDLCANRNGDAQAVSSKESSESGIRGSRSLPPSSAESIISN